MSLRFLPKPKADESYPVDSGSGFNGCQNDFLHKVATDMEAPPPKTQPRRPTPFSCLWQFAEDLGREDGSAFKERARQRFRGILGAIALRESENLPLQLVASAPLGENQDQIPIVEMFRQHFDNAPKGLISEGKRIFFLKLGGRVIAGLSPNCFVFPAANSVEFRSGIRPGWYSEKMGDWMDPTEDGLQFENSEERLSLASVTRWKAAMLPWLKELRDWIRGDGANWLTERQFLLNEVEDWIEDIGEIEDGGTSIQPTAIRCGDEEGLELLSTMFPFAYAAGGGERVTADEEGERLYLTKIDLANPQSELYRGVNGCPQYGAAWEGAPMAGDHLGEALGLHADERDILDVPYLLVDKLFADSISAIGTNLEGLGRGWELLEVEGDAYLYPFRNEVLDWFDLAELSACVQAEQLAEAISVRFRTERFDCVKTYNTDGIVDLDDFLDFRIFPDYDISRLPDLERQLPDAADRQFFTRVRLGEPLADVEIVPIVSEEGSGRCRRLTEGQYKKTVQGNLEPAGRNLGPGLQVRHAIPVDSSRRLVGFELIGRGFVSLQLPLPEAVAAGAVPKRIGIDFGTSNSCLSVGAGGNDQILNPTCRANSMLSKFRPGKRKESSEGWSALFDFFHVPPKVSDPGNELLFSRAFFPTQLASRRPFEAGSTWSNKVTPEEALVCFQSLTDVYVEDAQAVESLKGFSRQESEEVPAITLKDRLKWDDADSDGNNELLRDLRRVFHRDLRLRLIHSIAREGGFVNEVRASFPRAFNQLKKSRYEDELRHIWSDAKLRLFTESHAAAAFLEAGQGEDRYLIDVGGGTSDFSLFSGGQLREEASIRLAADCIDRFMLSVVAGPLREEIVTQIQGRAAFAPGSEDRQILDNFLKDPFVDPANAVESNHAFENAGAQRAVFYAIVTLLREKAGDDGAALVYQEVGQKVHEQVAIERFLQLVALFYGGLAYFAGRMHAAHLSAGGDRNHNIVISFAGNGSSHLAWLGGASQKRELQQFLVEMFRAGADLDESAPVRFHPLDDPKAAVSRGLLRVPDAAEDGGNDNTGRVYQGLHAEWGENAKCSDLREFYQQQGDLTSGWDVEESELWKFAGVVEKALKGGKLGDMNLSNRNATSWVKDEIERVKGELPGEVKERLADCRAEFSQQLQQQEDNIPLEPVFIAELAAYFELLRSE